MPAISREPLDAAIANLARSRAQQMASDTSRSDDLARLSTSALAGEVDQLRTRLATTATASPIQRQLATLAEQRTQAAQALAAAQEQIVTLRQRGAKDRDPRMRRHQAVAEQATQRLHALDDRERALETISSEPIPQDDPDGREHDLVRYEVLRDELARRHAFATQAAVADPPAYLTATLGPVPDQLTRRGLWQRAAREVERYRQRYEITDPDRPLGDHSDDLAQRAAHREVERLLERTQRDLAAARLPERERGAER